MEMAEVEQINRALVKTGKLFRALQALRLADLGLHPGQDVLLHLIAMHPEGQTVSALAQSLGVESPTITRSLDRLEPGGWIERHPDPQDRRALSVRPTRQTLDALPGIQQVWHDLATDATEPLSQKDVATLLRLLERVRASLTDTLEARAAGSATKALAE